MTVERKLADFHVENVTRNTFSENIAIFTGKISVAATISFLQKYFIEITDVPSDF